VGSHRRPATHDAESGRERTAVSDVKIGLYQPPSEYTMAGDSPRWEDIKRMTLVGEQVGFDSVWCADHLIFRTGSDVPEKGLWECWSTLSALAAVTERMEIGPLVTCLGFRNPALLAKMADTIDEISGGRFILGIGAGWHEPEYRAFGYPYDHRYSRFVEGIKIIASLIREGRAEFQGEYYRVEDCVLRPRGPRGGNLPIMIGTFGKKMMRVAAEYADIWNADWSQRFSEIKQHDEELTRACEEVGRDPATLERTACILVETEGAVGRGSSHASRNQPSAPMSNDQLVEVIGEYKDNGYTHLIIWIDPNTSDAIARFAPVIEQLKS
jgi:alkanesulfonate monooxygenase SsuD/methylene tetrahydromethanopterin reductase-like flavin-dependent oxidoreductase (luciferase family)